VSVEPSVDSANDVLGVHVCVHGDSICCGQFSPERQWWELL